MQNTNNVIFKKFENKIELFSNVATRCEQILSDALENDADVSFIVPGGSTPAPAFEQLSKSDIDWKKVFVAQSDERWLDRDHAQSNQRLTEENLLINNAKDAMVLNNINSEDRYFFISLKKENNCAVIRLKDSGGGIPNNIIDKVFEPYFTTKHKSIGTGIGLYMTFQIINNSFHGEINVQNRDYTYEDKLLTGAQFILEIPLKKE